jgi:hypothetical protein
MAGRRAREKSVIPVPLKHLLFTVSGLFESTQPVKGGIEMIIDVHTHMGWDFTFEKEFRREH